MNFIIDGIKKSWKYLSLSLVTLANFAMKMGPILQQEKKSVAGDSFTLIAGGLSMVYSFRNRLGKIRKDDQVKTYHTIKNLYIKQDEERSSSNSSESDDDENKSISADISIMIRNTDGKQLEETLLSTIPNKNTESKSTHNDATFYYINLFASIITLFTNFIASTGGLLTLYHLIPGYDEEFIDNQGDIGRYFIYASTIFVSIAAIDQFYRLRMKDNSRNINKLTDYLYRSPHSRGKVYFTIFLFSNFFTYALSNNYRGNNLVRTGINQSIHFWDTTESSFANNSSLTNHNLTQPSHYNKRQLLSDYQPWFTALGILNLTMGIVVTASNTQESTNFYKKTKSICHSFKKRFQQSNCVERVDILVLAILCASSQYIGFRSTVSSAKVIPIDNIFWNIFIGINAAVQQATSLLFDFSKIHFPNMEKMEVKINKLIAASILHENPLYFSSNASPLTPYVTLSTRAQHIYPLSIPSTFNLIPIAGTDSCRYSQTVFSLLCQAIKSDEPQNITLQKLSRIKQAILTAEQYNVPHYPEVKQSVSPQAPAPLHFPQATPGCCSSSKIKTTQLLSWLFKFILHERGKLASITESETPTNGISVNSAVYFLLLNAHTPATHPALDAFEQQNEQYADIKSLIDDPSHVVNVDNAHEFRIFCALKSTPTNHQENQAPDCAS